MIPLDWLSEATRAELRAVSRNGQVDFAPQDFDLLRTPALQEIEFVGAYLQLAKLSVCDAAGGVEYHRVLGEWIACGRPVCHDAFIRERANALPWALEN